MLSSDFREICRPDVPRGNRLCVQETPDEDVMGDIGSLNPMCS